MTCIATLLIFTQLVLGYTQDNPYRDEATYKLSLKMEFKSKLRPNNDRIEFENKKRFTSSPQLFLNTSLELLSLQEDDFKIRIVNSSGTVLVSKRLKSPDTYLFKLGYANSMKDRTSPNAFTIYFLNKEKKITSQIILEINEDGDFMVNRERFGKI